MGPSSAGEAGCPSAWEQGQDLESAISLGGPAGSWLRASVWNAGRGHVGLSWLPLTSGAISREGAMPLLIGNSKQSKSVLVVRVQWGHND